MTSQVEVPPLTGLIHFFSGKIRVKDCCEKSPSCDCFPFRVLTKTRIGLAYLARNKALTLENLIQKHNVIVEDTRIQLLIRFPNIVPECSQQCKFKCFPPWYLC